MAGNDGGGGFRGVGGGLVELDALGDGLGTVGQARPLLLEILDELFLVRPVDDVLEVGEIGVANGPGGQVGEEAGVWPGNVRVKADELVEVDGVDWPELQVVLELPLSPRVAFHELEGSAGEVLSARQTESRGEVGEGDGRHQSLRLLLGVPVVHQLVSKAETCPFHVATVLLDVAVVEEAAEEVLQVLESHATLEEVDDGEDADSLDVLEVVAAGQDAGPHEVGGGW